MARGRHSRNARKVVPIDPLRHRWIRLVRRGEMRRAAVVLRDLVRRDGRAADWVRLGVVLLRAGKSARGLEALKQGRYLFKRAGAGGKVETVDRLIAASADRAAAA